MTENLFSPVANEEFYKICAWAWSKSAIVPLHLPTVKVYSDERTSLSTAVCFMINGQHLKQQASTQTWTFCCRILWKGLFSSFPLSFFHFFSPRPAFLVCSPSLCPTPPFLPHYRELGPGHWPWTLTLPVISHIPGPFPPLRPQTAHRSSLPASPPPSLCLHIFSPFPLAGSRMATLAFDGVLLRDNRE